MRRRCLTYCRRSLMKKRTSPFIVACIVYLLVFIGTQVTSPTAASFNDTVQVVGNLSTANGVKEQEDNDANADIRPTKNRLDDKRDNGPISKDNGQDQGVTIDGTEDPRDLERLEKTDSHLKSDGSLQADNEEMDSAESNDEEKRSIINRGEDSDEVEDSL